MRLFIQHSESPSITIIEDVGLNQPLSEQIRISQDEYLWIEDGDEPIETHLTLLEIGIIEERPIVHGHRSRCKSVNVEVAYLGTGKHFAVSPNTTLQKLLDRAVKEFPIDATNAVDMVFRTYDSLADLDLSRHVGTLVGPTGCQVDLQLLPGEAHAGFGS